MKETNVDLLVIGDILCTNYASCFANTGLTAGMNRVEINADNVPDYVDLGEERFLLQNSIVIDTKGGALDMTSILVPDDKAVFASGDIIGGLMP